MRTIAFLALFALAANAFNLTAYHLGVDSQLGFNQTQVQDGLTCLNGLAADVDQIAQLLESENIVSIGLELASQVEQIQVTLQTTCRPYFVDLGTYYYQQTGDVNLTEKVEQNFHLFADQIIQQVAHWINLIEAGQDYQAGQVEAYINQVLLGIVVPVAIPAPQPTTIVAFNTSKFFSDYFTTIFQALGIQAPVNVSALVECHYNLQNVTATYIYIKQRFSTLDFNDQLNALQYVLSLGFETIRNCEGAADVAGNILIPQYEAFVQDPVSFTLEVANRVALDLPQYVASIRQEFVDIQEGNYVAAGQEKANRIINDFQGLVNYTTSN